MLPPLLICVLCLNGIWSYELTFKRLTKMKYRMYKSIVWTTCQLSRCLNHCKQWNCRYTSHHFYLRRNYTYYSLIYDMIKWNIQSTDPYCYSVQVKLGAIHGFIAKVLTHSCKDWPHSSGTLKSDKWWLTSWWLTRIVMAPLWVRLFSSWKPFTATIVHNKHLHCAKNL